MPLRPRWAARCSARRPTPNDRAARAPYGRIPAPGLPGNNLRRTARLLSTVTSVVADVPLAEMTLLMRFARLAEAIADLREAQRLAAQAAAARGRPNNCGPPCPGTSPAIGQAHPGPHYLS